MFCDEHGTSDYCTECAVKEFEQRLAIAEAKISQLQNAIDNALLNIAHCEAGHAAKELIVVASKTAQAEYWDLL